MSSSTSARRQEVFRGCERFLNAHGPRRAQAELLALASAATDQDADYYGAGGALEALEKQVAALLGKPAAVFMPSGTMAQQIAMRLHAEDAGCRTIAFHPTCHLELHEQRGYGKLHGLEAQLVGRRDRLIELSDLEALSEPLAALLLELPQRELGGLLPSFEALTAQAEWARRRGVALHMDGARLWECAPFYARPYAELSSLFDSVYVSFYKVLGAIAGAALAGDEAFVARARIWQRRHGGNLVTLYPMALSARLALEQRLPRMAEYQARAQRVAACLRGIEGVSISCDPPPTNMFHAFFPVDAERLIEASVALAGERKVAVFTRTRPCDVPGYCSVEISIGDAASAIDEGELDSLVRELIERAR
jgi:threonine aldolase